MKILVTGGGGYIGSALSIELAKQGHYVNVIDKFVHGQDSGKRLAFWGVNANPVDLIQVDPDCIQQFDVIYHLAAIAGSKACDDAGSNLTWDYNVENTRQLIDCLDNELIIFTSTSAIYGNSSLYTESKIAAEKSALLYLRSITIRLPTIFGISPCMRKNILVHDLVHSAVKNGYIVLWDKDSTRTWMPLKDCVSGLINLIENPGKYCSTVWDISGNFWTKQQIVKKIQWLTNCEVFLSKKRGKYIQDFPLVSLPKFNYCPDISSTITNTIEELVTYYEGTKHTPTIDWSK